MEEVTFGPKTEIGRSLRLIRTFIVFLACLSTTSMMSGCVSDGGGEPPTRDEIRRYFDDVESVLIRAYARFEGLLRIFDEESYADALNENSRLFNEGAEELRQMEPPSPFRDEHEDFAASLDGFGDQLAEEFARIGKEDFADVLASQLSGPLAQAESRHNSACLELTRQADEFAFYDVFACGGEPYFIQAVEPAWAHRVHVNTCCGGSDPRSSPLDIFYGSDNGWDRTLEHYREEMTKRGFTDVSESKRYAPRISFSKPDRPQECFWVEEYSEESLSPYVEESEVSELADYDYAFVTGYSLICGG